MTRSQVEHDRKIAERVWEACVQSSYDGEWGVTVKAAYLDREYPLPAEIRPRVLTVGGWNHTLGADGQVDSRMATFTTLAADIRWRPSDYELIASLATHPCETQIDGEWVPCDAKGKAPEPRVVAVPEDVKQAARGIVASNLPTFTNTSIVARWILSLAEGAK